MTNSSEQTRREAVDEAFYARADRAKKNAREHAISVAVKFEADVDHVVTDPIPVVFGNRWAKSAGEARGRLIETYGQLAIWLVRLAIWHFEYAKWDASGFMANLLESELGTKDEKAVNEVWSRLVTPNGYADHTGWAYTAYNCFAEIDKPRELLSRSPLQDYPPDSVMNEVLGLVWFFEAARNYDAGDSRWMDILFESSDAFSLANGLYMWDAGHEMGKEEQTSQAVRALARKAANARHAENREISDQVKSWFRENGHLYPSLEKAAEAVIKLEPISRRTAYRHISDEAKKLRSARKE